MMKTLLFAAFALSLSSGAVLAGEAKVSFTKLDDFSDIKAGNENKERFRERLRKNYLKTLTTHYQTIIILI